AGIYRAGRQIVLGEIIAVLENLLGFVVAGQVDLRKAVGVQRLILLRQHVHPDPVGPGAIIAVVKAPGGDPTPLKLGDFRGELGDLVVGEGLVVRGHVHAGSLKGRLINPDGEVGRPVLDHAVNLARANIQRTVGLVIVVGGSQIVGLEHGAGVEV